MREWTERHIRELIKTEAGKGGGGRTNLIKVGSVAPANAVKLNTQFLKYNKYSNPEWDRGSKSIEFQLQNIQFEQYFLGIGVNVFGQLGSSVVFGEVEVPYDGDAFGPKLQIPYQIEFSDFTINYDIKSNSYKWVGGGTGFLSFPTCGFAYSGNSNDEFIVRLPGDRYSISGGEPEISVYKM